MIPILIDKLDNFEVVRDQIAAILASEVASQMSLAKTAGKDPQDWKLRIFSERSNPWEQFIDVSDDTSPLVNVWVDNASYDPKASNSTDRQKSETVYNIDCYGYAVSADNPAGGHAPGDKEAAFEVHKCVRLVRNILMAAEYKYLSLQGTVWGRWPQSLTIFQPQLDGRSMQHIVGARLAFRVSFNEFAPQVAEEVLELVSIDFKRAEDGEILVEADYDYTV